MKHNHIYYAEFLFTQNGDLAMIIRHLRFCCFEINRCTWMVEHTLLLNNQLTCTMARL